MVRALFPAVLLLASSALVSPAGYRAPVVEPPAFAGGHVMLSATERDKLATSLAGFVAATTKPDSNARKLTVARRLLGLALHMSPRNRAALVTSFKFTRGHAPKEFAVDYGAATLAEIIRTHAGTLKAAGGEANIRLAGYLLVAATEVDIDNESAVYELEIHKRDHGPIDWRALVGD